jgi:septal ring factor EnvC (AmiA/AmiB activator)
MSQVFQFASLAISTIACCLAAASFFRTKSWRDTDEAKALVGRISQVESRLSVIESEVEGLPTKADIARLEEQVRSVDHNVDRAQRGIDRLESYFLQTGIGGAK